MGKGPEPVPIRTIILSYVSDRASHCSQLVDLGRRLPVAYDMAIARIF